MGARLRNAASFLAVLGAEAAALAALHRAGGWLPGAAVDWGDLGAWLADVAPEDAVVAAVRAAGLAVGWWLLATTVLYAAARAARLPGLVRGVGWATLPALRRVVDGALATSVVAGSTFGGAGVALAVAGDDRVVVRIEAPPPGAGANTPAVYRPTPAGDPEVPGDPEAAVAAGEAVPADPEVNPGEGAEGPEDLDDLTGSGSGEFPPPEPSSPPTTAAPGYRPAPAGEAAPARPAAPPAAPDPARREAPTPAPSLPLAADPPGRTAPAVGFPPSRPGRPGAVPAAPTASGEVPVPAGAVTYTIRRGDNLWRIAARRVAAETGRPVATLGEDEVRAYWVRLVRANEDRLASGDPDLIHPGEELVLPALFEHR